MDTEAVCKCSMFLGNGCGKCRKCKQEVSNTNEQGNMPCGVELEVYRPVDDEWFLVECLYNGESSSLVRLHDGVTEIAISNKSKWRYPIDPAQQKRNKILESWNRTSLDHAHDTEKSMAHIGTFIDMLFAEGFVEVK